MNKLTSYPSAGFVAVVLSALSSPICAQSFFGEVYDLGEPNSAKSGIGAVTVILREANGQVVTRGITDATGSYALNLPGEPKGTLSASFEKVGFFSYPTLRQVMQLKVAQPKVPMSRGGAQSEYYRAVAGSVIKASSTDGNEGRQAIAAVATLPTADKVRVEGELKAAASPKLLKDFEAASRLSTTTSQFTNQLIDRKWGYFDVGDLRVVPSDPRTGVVWMTGSVPDRQQRTKLEQLLKEVEGVKGVQNDLVVRSELRKAAVP